MSAEDARVRVPDGPLRCASCHDELSPEGRVACAVCLAAHHRACWDEGAVCASCGGAEPWAATGADGVAVASPSAPPVDRARLAGAVLRALGYRELARPRPDVAVYGRRSRMLLSFPGSRFEDLWVVVEGAGDAAEACQAGLEAADRAAFPGWFARLTRDAFVNFVVVSEVASGLPAPSRTRGMFSPTIYTVTSCPPAGPGLHTDSVWSGGTAAQQVLVPLRFALAEGRVPGNLRRLDEDEAARGSSGVLALGLAAALVALILIGLLVTALARVGS